ncbi:hypothetical protein [Novosphingobium sp. NBM11]|uniref:hypothetical protein n=1 Tax=Novosphingobium sp. NBM11 TaxID=2596914 RepID=UPI001892117A|nr:hypothetical protein [Novosphingobium sp. NBM11]
MIVPIVTFAVGFSFGTAFGAWWAVRPSAQQRSSRIRPMDERPSARPMERRL